MKYLSLLTLTLLLFVFTVSCRKDSNNGGNGIDPSSKFAPDGFNYATSKKVNLDIRLLSNNNYPLNGIVISIYSQNNPKEPLLKGVSDDNGYFKTSVNIPSYIDTLLIEPNYVGLPQQAKTYISGNTVSCVLGGEKSLSGNVVLPAPINKVVSSKAMTSISETSFNYMGSYDWYGRPVGYMEATQDIISKDLLSYINFSLPDGNDVRTHHPDYLSSAATANLNITQTSDVWVTFVSEGAGNTNSIGYYTYPTGTPPKKLADINDIYIVLPNASGTGTGGNMKSGDKIKLGRFSSGTSIGFVLVANGWNNTYKFVNTNNPLYFSDPALNPETSDNLKKHTVLLNYPKDNLLVMGFEDLNRTSPACDHDFNDIVMYATSNPVGGISRDGVKPLDQPTDTDNDGITDVFDQFPNDASRAYLNYFPSQNTWGTLAYEDLWPGVGDYDLNDLVLSYRYKFASNAKNEVVDITGEYAVLASGASFKNGFGVEFPFSASLVSKVTGQKLVSSYITQAASGLESGQTKAVIIPFDNHTSMIKYPPGSTYINTTTDQAKIGSDTARVNITFTSPITTATLGTAPFNPFMISNLRRGYEVHLPGQTPTGKADTKLFSTLQDNTNTAKGIYYLTKDNRPWAISFTEPFSYPIEAVSIEKTYLHFADWANSGGTLYTDWYKNTAAGYRDTKNIYSK